MNEKQRRQQLIKDMVIQKKIRTQTEMLELLQEAEIMATQATLSRDLLELGIDKPRRSDYYRFTEAGKPDPELPIAAFAPFIEQIESAANIVVIKTKPGAAQNVAQRLDSLVIPEAIGTVAGDDTIFIATGSEDSADRTARRLYQVLRIERRESE